MTTPRLHLEPLRADHAVEAEPIFRETSLYEFTGGGPQTVDELRDRYTRQSAGRSPDGLETWLNWMVRSRTTAELVGTVQATLTRMDDGEPVAELAWVMGAGQHGQGYATESARAVKHWLELVGVHRFAANIHPEHGASQRVAAHLGLSPSDRMVDGEVHWMN